MNKLNIFFLFFFISLVSYSNSDTNNNIEITVHINEKSSPETLRDLLEGTTNYIFYDRTWKIDKDDKLTNVSAPYFWGDKIFTDSDKIILTRHLKKLISDYFWNRDKSINGSVHYINNMSGYFSKATYNEDKAKNLCKTLVFLIDDSSAEYTMTNKAKNASVKNLELIATDCNANVYNVTIPEINSFRSRKGLNFYWETSVRNSMDKLVLPMKLDAQYYYSDLTPKKERRYIMLNGQSLNENKILAEEELKKYIGKRKKSFEGIYEVNSATEDKPKYKIAILELPSDSTWGDEDSSTIYAGIYISGATQGEEQWNVGDVKFYFRSTIKENYYEMKYYMANKDISTDAALKFGYLTNDNTIWTTDSPASSYFQGAFISINREDNSLYYSNDYWVRKYPYNPKPSKSKPKSSKPTYKPKSKSEPPKKGVKIG